MITKTIKCPKCGEDFELSDALFKDVEASSWYSCISPCVILLYPNHRLRNIMCGPNLAETAHTDRFKFRLFLENFHDIGEKVNGITLELDKLENILKPMRSGKDELS